MKKVLCLLVVLTMALGCIGISASAAEYGTVLNNNVAMLVGSTRAVAGNTLVTISAAPAEVDGEMLVPVSVFADIFGGTAYQDEASGFVDVSFGADKVVALRSDSQTFTLNGRAYGFDVAPQEVNGVLMVPMKEIAEDVLGEYYFYDTTTKLAVVSGRKVLKDYATDGAVIATIANAINSGSLPPISVPDYYEIDWSQFNDVEDIAGGGANVSNDQGQLPFVSVTVSAEPEPQNNGNNLIDGNPGSFWAIGDLGGSAVLDIGKVNNMTEIKVAFAKYTERAAQYEVWASADNKNFDRIFSGASVQGQQWASHEVSGAYRYVRIVSNGNSNNSTWNSIAEVQAFNGGGGATANTPTVIVTADPIPNSAFTYTASAEPEPQNNAAMAFDNNNDTYWAASNDGGAQNLTLTLGEATYVSSISLHIRPYDDGRSLNYGVEYSTDGSSYTSVFDGQSQPGGGSDEAYPIDANVKSVRINVNGSTTGPWTSICEVVLYGAAKETVVGGDTGSSSGAVSVGDEIPSSSYTYTATAEPEANNPARSAFDGNPDTFWAAENSQSVTIDLGGAKMVGGVGVQMRHYTDNPGRAVNYTVEYSTDGATYTNAFSGAATAGGGTMETRNVGVEARYIRVSVNGSNEGSWASVAEIKVYGAGSTGSAGGSASAGYKNMPSVSGQFMLAEAGTTNVLTVASDNTTLGVGADSGNASKWTLSGSTVMNVGCNYAMDVFNQSMDEGGQVGVWESNGGTNQQWAFESDGDGYYVRNSMSGLYLAAVGNSIQQRSKGSATKWVVTDGTMDSVSAPASTESYKNMSSVSGDFMLAVAGTTNVLSVGGDGTTLGVGASEQKWTLDGGAVKNVTTGKYMDVFNESYDEGGQVGVWDGNGGINQQWSFESDGDGYYVKSAMSGLYLSVVGGAVQQRSRTSATKWVVTDGTKVTTAAGGTAGSNTVDISTIEGEYILTVDGTNDSLAIGPDNELIVTPYTGNPSQAWYSDTSFVVNSGTGLCMDVYESSVRTGILICATPKGSSSTQRWDFVADGNGYVIKNRETGFYISVIDGLVHQRALANATRFVLTSTGNAVVHPEAVVTPAGYANMSNVSGEFMIAVYGGTDVLSVNDDNFSLSVGASGGRSMWSLDGQSLKNTASGLYMDVSDQSMDDGHAIIVWEGNGGTNQQWALENDGDGYYIKSVMSDLYLSVVGSDVQQKSRNSATKWVITDGSTAETVTTPVTTPVVTPVVNNSSYTNLDILPAEFLLVLYGTDDVLTVASDNVTLGVSAYTQSGQQQWTLDGVSFKNVGCGLVMDVSGQSKDDGGAICVWEANGGDNQIWAFEKDGDGYYVKSILSGLYLSVVDGNVQQKTKASASKWMIANK